MSDPRLNDPNRNHASIDPNDPHPNQDFAPSAQASREAAGSGMMWGWIAGIAVVVLIVAFMFGNTNSTQQANNQTAPVTRSTPAPTGAANSGSPSPNLGTTTNGSGTTTGSGSTNR